MSPRKTFRTNKRRRQTYVHLIFAYSVPRYANIAVNPDRFTPFRELNMSLLIIMYIELAGRMNAQ